MTEGLEDTHLVDPLLMRVIAGKMELRQVLGAGAMGVVYRAHHLALDKQIAIKVLRHEGKSDPTRARRFKAEARAASRLDHPNSVHVLDFGEDGPDGLLYLAMEFLEGEDLQSMLKREHALSPERAARIMVQVLGALSAAHDSGVIHRDMKPGNVMLLRRTDDDGHTEDFVKVCDFGLAKILDGLEDASGAPLTKQGAIFGTPSYMSPEQARGDPLDARTDVYACGVILYRMLTGEAPFTADSAWGILMKHLNDPVPPMSKWVPDLPPELVRITERALVKDREGRFQSAREMRAAVKAFLRDGGEEGELSAPVQAVAPVLRSPSLTVPADVPPRRSSLTMSVDTLEATQAARALDEAGPGTQVSMSNAPLKGGKKPWLLVAALVLMVGGVGAWAFMQGPMAESLDDGALAVVGAPGSSAPSAGASAPSAPAASASAPSTPAASAPSAPGATASEPPSLPPPSASASPETGSSAAPDDPDPSPGPRTRRTARPRRPGRDPADAPAIAAPTVSASPPAASPPPASAPPPSAPPPSASASPPPPPPKAGPARVEMKVTTVKVTGGISGRAVETRLAKSVDAARKCVERVVLGGKEQVSGAFDVRGTVDLRGRLTNVKVTGISGASATCVVDALEGTMLPKPDTGEALLAIGLDYRSS